MNLLFIVQFEFFTLLGLEASAEQLQEHVNLIDGILKEFGQPEFYKDPKFHVSLIWCLPITENLSGVGISKESATINLEKQLKECIEEINRDLKAAYQTGEVCYSKHYHYTFKMVENFSSNLIDRLWCQLFIFSDLQLEAAGFVVSNLTAKIGDKYFEFQLNSS